MAIMGKTPHPLEDILTDLVRTGASTGRDLAFVARWAASRVIEHGPDWNPFAILGYTPHTIVPHSYGKLEQIGEQKDSDSALLFHVGYGANATTQPILNVLSDYYGHNVYVMVQPFYKSIKEQAGNLAMRIAELSQQYNNLVLIGHSMGGLIGEYYLKRLRNSQDNIRRYISLASPHLGTLDADVGYAAGEVAAYVLPEFLQKLFFYNASVNEMRIMNPFVKDLWESSFPEDVHTYAFVPTRDNFVTPAESGLMNSTSLNFLLPFLSNHIVVLGDSNTAYWINEVIQRDHEDLEQQTRSRLFTPSLQMRVYGQTLAALKRISPLFSITSLEGLSHRFEEFRGIFAKHEFNIGIARPQKNLRGTSDRVSSSAVRRRILV